jgi:predicted ATPase
LSLPESRYAPLNLSPQRQRQKTLETIVAILLELAEQHPVLLIIEDLHWTDPTTLELLNLVLDQTPTASLLVLLTCRPTFQPSWHHRSYITEMTLNRLSQPQIERMVERVTGGKTLPTAVLQQIIAKTDGVPLFVEEITKATLESGSLKEIDEHYELTGSLSTFAVPATLQDSLMARLDRLVTAKAVAQYAAVLGRQFPYDLLYTVSQLDEATLQRELGRLVESEIVYQRGLPPQATYVFKHALIQDAAYQSLLKSTRQLYHQRIAQVLEAQYPEIAETQPELLAHHYTEAGLHKQALAYWQQAGQRAITRSAHVEAIEHLTTGLALLTGELPETQERAQYELQILTLLGPVLMATKGYGSAEVIHTYNRARELCQQCADTPQTLAVFLELSRLEFVRAQYRPSLELSQQCLRMAQRQHEPMFLTGAHVRLGAAFSLLGDLSAARTHLEQALNLYHAQSPRSAGATQDPGVACLSFLAWTLVPLGYLDHALACMHQALTLAHARSHPFSLAFATSHTAFIHQLRREVQAAQEQAEVAIRITTEQSFPLLLGYATLFRGWALAEQGESVEGITQICQGLTRYRSTGQENFTTYYLAILVEAYGKHGQVDNALCTLDEAFALVEANNERYYAAELHRLKGELLLRQSSRSQPEAETCFQHAISIAQSQQAKSFELRATTNLAKLWQQQGKRQEAHDLLAPIYHWFTEGFETADLKDAKVLLDELA